MRVRKRLPYLGLTPSQDAAIGGTAGSVIPGVGTAVGTAVGEAVGLIENAFAAGAAVNATRESQVNFFTMAALAGSVIAVQFMRGGVINCVKSEAAMFSAGLATVQQQAPSVYTAGMQAAPLWISTSFPQMQAQVNASLTALEASLTAGSTSGSTSGGFSLSPVMLVVGAALVLFLFMRD